MEKTADQNVSCLKKELQLGNGEETIDLTEIKKILLQEEKLNSSRIQTSPHVRVTNSSLSINTSNIFENTFDLDLLSLQDEDLVNILEELQNRTEVSGNTSSNRLKGHFCSDTVFNLSHRVLSDAEIKILEKGFDFAPIQRKINEPELRRDFEEFYRRMRIKWHFRSEPTSDFSNIPTFAPKSAWKPPKGHPNLEVFLSQVESDLFKAIERPIGYSNLSKEEWDAIRLLVDDRNIVIKRADKGSCVVIWDRHHYVKEAEIQLSIQNVYKSVEFKDKILSELVEKSNHFFKSLKARGIISKKELQHFTYKYKKTSNLGKMYLLPKIHKRLYDAPGRPVISNCGTPTEKVSEFLDHHLKPLIQEGDSYIKDTGDFLNKIKNINAIPENAILVTADVVGLYPSIPHQAGLEALREALEKRKTHKVPTSKLIKIAEFVLKNNYFQFSDKVYQQISGTAIDTKFAPPYACIFMDQVESKFLQTQKFQPLVWFRYIDDIFFIWTHVKKVSKIL